MFRVKVDRREFVVFKTLRITPADCVLKGKGSCVNSNHHSKAQKMENVQTLEAEIAQLEAQLTGNMFEDMDIKDKIHNLTMKLNGVRPMDSYIECVGCGS